MYNNYIYLQNKLFEITDRKCNDMKFRSRDQRSINGTLTIDNIGTPKKKWEFTFDCNDRQLTRIYSIFELNTVLTLVDVDNTSYSCACVNLEFPYNHIMRDGIDYYTVPLNFEQI
jgi:hypothetical protein